MSTHKHTPGPWCYQKETTISVIGGGNTRRVRFEVYKMNGVYGHPATCGNEEDARLIAAAPELLGALECLLPHVLHYAAMPIASSDAHRDAAFARAAIAKATGEQPS